MNFILEQALRAGLMGLLGHAVPPSVAGAHPEYVKVENAWIAQVMAYVGGKRKDFPMPPSWLLVAAVMPQAAEIAAAAMQIAGHHLARMQEQPAESEAKAVATEPVEAPAAKTDAKPKAEVKPPEAPAVETPAPSESAGEIIPSASEGTPTQSASEGKE